MSNAFVILFHTGHGGDHLDLLLDLQDGPLATWQLMASPIDIGKATSIAAAKLPDHRRKYLEYEGTISGGRGEVKRVDAGSVDVLEITADRLLLQFAGTLLTGRWLLQRRQDNDWAFSLYEPRADRR